MFEEIWRVADARITKGDTPGYVAAVRINGETRFTPPAAMAFDGPPMRADTLFRIASLTKPIGGRADARPDRGRRRWGSTTRSSATCRSCPAPRPSATC